MISPYRGKQVRSRPRAIAEILDNCTGTYLIVSQHGDGLWFRETQVGETKADVVELIASGEAKCAVAVLRVSLGEKPENVSEDIARDIIASLDKDGRLFAEDERHVPDFVYAAWSGAEAAIQEIEDDIRGEAEHIATERSFARRY